ncbi:OsmC family protein [Neptuniibacter sp. CAU 1671]|uniref:OsmC family protein n=1 Tax=Neptuniibacter sp. CAU 1671 TaxID=3032593 RepID=UPI0023DB6CD6|nr:OsmC family protein [Neptuniibacter sp. CAU 1671]MDF2181725.1 OsmC family protein [Neptuniibacter sp. CAU 1671]
MSALKTVQISANMQQGWKIESNIRDHHVVIDQPKYGGGTDLGPTPLEYFLFAMAGCIGTIGRIVAHQEKITLRGMEVDVSGEMDADGLMGRSPDAPIGFTSITISAKIDADLTEAEKTAFLTKVCHRCPLHANLTDRSVVEHRVV